MTVTQRSDDNVERQCFDFIVVGSGPSGASLAFRLADASGKPSVLLLEAGAAHDDAELLVAGQRNTFFMTGGLKLDQGYSTVPQHALGGRELRYHRGKGLGGSSATNIGVWDHGCKPDMDEWARQVGDDWWQWQNTEPHFRELANLHNLTPSQYQRYVQPDTMALAQKGLVDVSYAPVWDPCLPSIFDLLEEKKLPLNPDISSSRGLGMGIAPATVIGAARVTASTAYLKHKKSNLQIFPESQVHRVLFEGTQARAIELVDGTTFSASKEIIICAGAIDTPKILLLSGVGDRQALAQLGISTVLDQPRIGLELKDHPMLRLGAAIDTSVFAHRPLAAGSEDIAAAAQGYLRLDSTHLSEQAQWSPQTQSYLDNKLQPTHELLLRVVPSPGPAGNPILVAVIVLMNTQSLGKIKLSSKNPEDAPIIDLNLLSHSYDMHLAREVIKATMPVIRDSSVIPTKSLILGPEVMEDVAIEKFVRDTASHLWHACGTVKMGKPGDTNACVTSDFRVQGLQGLRVADLSVAPILPSHHTQSTAYLIGERAAAVLIAEYRLDV